MERALKKPAFFKRMAKDGVALAYDDVLLETQVSQVAPSEVDILSRFSRSVELKTPFISAPMDTVTTSEMAIAIAKLGGLGVIHAGLSIEVQSKEVRQVKLFLNGLIEKPITIDGAQSVENVLSMRHERGFKFSTFPVVDSDGKLTGLLTQNDFDFCRDITDSVASVMTTLEDINSAPIGTTVAEAHEIMLRNKKKTLPLVDENGVIAGLYIFSDVNRIVIDNSGQYNVDKNDRLRVAAAVPTDEDAITRVREMLRYLDVVVIDTAQGDSKFAFQTLKQLKEEFSELDVVVGNISSGRSARKLAEAGADGIKVGQGLGAACITRVETSIGCPQISAVFECVKAISELDVPVCADGGIRDPGHISLAIAAGASSVMIGSLFAGTKEAPGDIKNLIDGKPVKLYRGMGSPSALKESAASRKRYGADGIGIPLAEGVEAYIPYKGSVVELIEHYRKSLRRSMSYVGSTNISAHQNDTRFYRVTNAGARESQAHILD